MFLMKNQYFDKLFSEQKSYFLKKHKKNIFGPVATRLIIFPNFGKIQKCAKSISSQLTDDPKIHKKL